MLGALYVLQALIALARRAGGDRIIDNRPLLLMSGSRVLHANLGQVRVTESELMARLRAHGVLRLDQVKAVVMESTGTMSVLASENDLDPAILTGVLGADGPVPAA